MASPQSQAEAAARRRKPQGLSRPAGAGATAGQRRKAQTALLKFHRALAKLPIEKRQPDVALYDEFGLPL